jgi:hypothetical protein
MGKSKLVFIPVPRNNINYNYLSANPWRYLVRGDAISLTSILKCSTAVAGDEIASLGFY